MCILFLYSGEENSASDYSLILATNRDENFARPAISAAFWEDNPNIIGGRDMEKGREGGTWLALSVQTGRLGVLLNLTGNPKTEAKGRGSIVTDYVQYNRSTKEYVKQLEPDRELYNDFNLVTVEIGKNKSTVHCYNNSENNLTTVDDAWSGYSNSLLSTPFKKVTVGRDRFRTICSEYAKTDSRDTLTEKLFELLQWTDKHLPDSELERRCPHWCDKLSSVFVHIPDEGYGTRSQTLVLVKKNGETEFIERSLQHPINPLSPSWQTSQYKFQLKV